MKGRDGVAEHESIYYAQTVLLGTILAAPGVGRQIVVFSVTATNAVANLILLQDGVPTIYWGVNPAAARPVPSEDEYGLFTLPDNARLDLSNPGLGWVRMTITYEIRPTGI